MIERSQNEFKRVEMLIVVLVINKKKMEERKESRERKTFISLRKSELEKIGNFHFQMTQMELGHTSNQLSWTGS